MSKTFTHAGVSKQDGEFKVRFANDATRVKVLQKNGHTDIDIVELKNPMTKEDAIAYLMSIDFANGNAAVEQALEQAVEARAVSLKTKEPKAVKEPKKAVVAKVPAKKAAVKKAIAPVADKVTEDAPF